MTEQVSKLNDHWVNQECLKALHKAKVPVVSHLPYSLQLVQWVVEKHPDRVPDPMERFLYDLKDRLEAMRERPPQDVLEWLAGQVEDGEVRFEAPVSNRPPVDTGLALLENLYWNLERVNPAFRINPPFPD